MNIGRSTAGRGVGEGRLLLIAGRSLAALVNDKNVRAC
jgi:hypothetical protein